MFRQELSRVIPRISLISQAYIDYLQQPLLILKQGSEVGFLRYLRKRPKVSLMFLEEHQSASPASRRCFDPGRVLLLLERCGEYRRIYSEASFDVCRNRIAHKNWARQERLGEDDASVGQGVERVLLIARLTFQSADPDAQARAHRGEHRAPRFAGARSWPVSAKGRSPAS